MTLENLTPQQLCQALGDLNEASFDANYPDQAGETLDPLPPFQEKPATMIQVYKWFDYYLYQCDWCDQQPLYLEIEKIKNIIACDIVEATTEYKELPWS